MRRRRRRPAKTVTCLRREKEFKGCTLTGRPRKYCSKECTYLSYKRRRKPICKLGHDLLLSDSHTKHGSCLECVKKINSRADVQHRKRVKYYEQEYGITIVQYDKAFEMQGGVCAICGKPPKPGRRLAVDHDHKPPHRVRGLLDFVCNRYVLGRRREDPALLERAAAYLRSDFDMRMI